MDADTIGKLERIVEKCTAFIKKIESLKQQCSQFLADIHATGQPLFSQHNLKKIDDKLSGILGNFDQFELNDFLLYDEAFSYTIPHHPKETSNPDENNSPTYEMEHVEGDKPWLFMLKYKKDERWKHLKRTLRKNLTENLLTPYEKPPLPGSHVLFSERNRVSRGLILQVLSPQRDRVNSVKLLDVDSHEIKFVASNKLYHVNLTAASVHSQILHCFLDSDFDSSLWPGELNNIFARALRDNTLFVTLLSRRNDDDIETTYVPSYAVRILAVKKEEEIVIDINDWILKHVYPALERSNGSYHSIDLDIFDPYQYCLSDEECAKLINEDFEDRLADFDDAQTDVMSCLSEMTITQRDMPRKSLSLPLASSEKNKGLSPHAIEFSFDSSASSNTSGNIGASDMKLKVSEEVKKDMFADLLQRYKQNIETESFDNILHTVFSQDECKELVSNTSDQDKVISSSYTEKPEISPQNDIASKPKETDVEEIPKKSVSSEAEIVEAKEPSTITSNLDSKHEKIYEKPLKIAAAAKTLLLASSETQPLASSVTQSPASPVTQLTSSSVTQPPILSETQASSIQYQFTNPNLVASYGPDYRLYPRRSSQTPSASLPPGFIPNRPAPHYQQICPPPPMVRPQYYGMQHNFQGASMYVQNQYPNQYYGYNQGQANLSMPYYQPQPRFGPPMVNHMYNPALINSTPLNQQQNSPYSSGYGPMMTNQTLPLATSVSKSTASRVSAVGLEAKKCRSSSSLSYDSDSKDSVFEATSNKSKLKKAQSGSVSSIPESVSQSKWSTNDLEGSPIVGARSVSSKLSTTGNLNGTNPTKKPRTQPDPRFPKKRSLKITN